MLPALRCVWHIKAIVGLIDKTLYFFSFSFSLFSFFSLFVLHYKSIIIVINFHFGYEYII